MNSDKTSELWRIEEEFWLGDADFYLRKLVPGALMVLPEPAGILDRTATIDSIRSAARWQHIVFTEQHQILPSTTMAVLAYRVQANRGSPDTSYSAQCSSTYVHDGGQWLLVLHHQTAAG